VLLAEDDGYFRPVPVKTGQEAGDRVVILEGLTEGQQVVVSAQFLIDSETSLEAAMLRLEPEEQNTTGMTDTDNSAPELFEATGRITELDTENASVTLDHGPIADLGWPAMTMAFDLAESVETGALATDQTVTFGFRETPEGYLVERIEPAQDAQ
jgi:Cu(I)/Ag(I) efflux system membrane fusion protein